MIYIDEQEIKIHKGNAAGFHIQFTGDELPEDGTTVIFRVKKNENWIVPAIEKMTHIEDGGIDVFFNPEDTLNLDFGDYHWNLIIMYEDGKEPLTVLEFAPLFIILPEDGKCGV